MKIKFNEDNEVNNPKGVEAADTASEYDKNTRKSSNNQEKVNDDKLIKKIDKIDFDKSFSDFTSSLRKMLKEREARKNRGERIEQGLERVIESDKEDLASVLDKLMDKNISTIRGKETAKIADLSRLKKFMKEFREQGMDEDDAYVEAQEKLKKWRKSKGRTKASGTYSQPLNLLIWGEPGGGKSSIIEQWATSNNLAICSFTGSELTEKVFQGAVYRNPEAYRVHPKSGKTGKREVADVLSNSRLDLLDAPMMKDENGNYLFTNEDNEPFDYSILVLDELNRADVSAQSPLLNLITSRSISESNPEWAINGKRPFTKFLFTIAACNPARDDKEKQQLYLSLAMRTRFEAYYWNADPKQLDRFLTKEYTARIEDMEEALEGYESDNQNGQNDDIIEYYKREIEQWKGRLKILHIVCRTPGFKFSDAEDAIQANANYKNSSMKTGKDKSGDALEGLTMSARTFQNCLEHSDGTIGSIDDSHSSGFSDDSFLAHLRVNVGNNDRANHVEDILLSYGIKNDARNGVFTNNLYVMANKALKNYAKELGVSPDKLEVRA